MGGGTLAENGQGPRDPDLLEGVRARALRELLVREDVDGAEARVLEAIFVAMARVPSWAELQDVREALERGDVVRWARG